MPGIGEVFKRQRFLLLLAKYDTALLTEEKALIDCFLLTSAIWWCSFK